MKDHCDEDERTRDAEDVVSEGAQNHIQKTLLFLAAQ